MNWRSGESSICWLALRGLLVGLMFVVVSLRPLLLAAQPSSVRAFCTPIIIDFTTAMVVSAVMMVPSFPSVMLASILAALGAVGVIYQFTIGAHSLWRENKLSLIDWVWFIGLPFLSYAILLIVSIDVWRQGSFGLFGVAAGALLFVIIGIRNAWDVVLWVAQKPAPDTPK